MSTTYRLIFFKLNEPNLGGQIVNIHVCENRKQSLREKICAQTVEIVENSNKFSRFPVEITDPGIAGSEYHTESDSPDHAAFASDRKPDSSCGCRLPVPPFEPARFGGRKMLVSNRILKSLTK